MDDNFVSPVQRMADLPRCGLQRLVSDLAQARPGPWPTLPYSYTFQFSGHMFGRTWYTASTTVCTQLRIFSTAAVIVQVWKAPAGIQTSQISTSASFPANGGWYYFCWTGLPANYHDLTFKYISSWAQGEATRISWRGLDVRWTVAAQSTAPCTVARQVRCL